MRHAANSILENNCFGPRKPEKSGTFVLADAQQRWEILKCFGSVWYVLYAHNATRKVCIKIKFSDIINELCEGTPFFINQL